MPRRILEGNVVSAKCDKTITVLVERRFMHPVYKKYIKSSSKYTAHDESNQSKEGDRVSIIECRPISKSKRWKLVSDDAAPAPGAAMSAKKAEEKKTEAKKPAAKKAAAKKPAAKKTTETKKDAK